MHSTSGTERVRAALTHSKACGRGLKKRKPFLPMHCGKCRRPLPRGFTERLSVAQWRAAVRRGYFLDAACTEKFKRERQQARDRACGTSHPAPLLREGMRVRIKPPHTWAGHVGMIVRAGTRPVRGTSNGTSGKPRIAHYRVLLDKLAPQQSLEIRKTCFEHELETLI